MKKTVQLFISALVMFLMAIFLMPSSVWAANAAGKKVFLDNKCNKCHAMKSQGIQALPKAEDADEGDKDADAGEKIEPPDLSKLDDAFLKSAGTPDESLKKWLKKEVEVTYKGKARKHKKQFNGSDADLTAIVQFLQGK
jgi:hypothetical protein